jgi:hypothetical protein
MVFACGHDVFEGGLSTVARGGCWRSALLGSNSVPSYGGTTFAYGDMNSRGWRTQRVSRLTEPVDNPLAEVAPRKREA